MWLSSTTKKVPGISDKSFIILLLLYGATNQQQLRWLYNSAKTGCKPYNNTVINNTETSLDIFEKSQQKKKRSVKELLIVVWYLSSIRRFLAFVYVFFPSQKLQKYTLLITF